MEISDTNIGINNNTKPTTQIRRILNQHHCLILCEKGNGKRANRPYRPFAQYKNEI